MPVPIPTTDGRLFADGLVVMTYLEGGRPETEADWRRVADMLRRLHRLTAAWPQRPGWRSSTDLLHSETGTDWLAASIAAAARPVQSGTFKPCSRDAWGAEPGPSGLGPARGDNSVATVRREERCRPKAQVIEKRIRATSRG